MTVTKNEVVPFNYQGSQVRTVQIDGHPHFIAKDVCEVLGIINHKDAVKRLDPDELTGSVVPTQYGAKEMHVINESGLYHLVFTSTRPGAKAFRKWVTSEVLPTLRRTGTYGGYPATTVHGQGYLFQVEDLEVLRAQRLMVDVALQCKPGSKIAQFLRIVKPMLFRNTQTPLQ